MASCIVCNEQTESQYEERNMAKFRTRLEKLMEEAVPDDSVICSGCQFDLEQIEMYYCLLNALKKRYWDAAEERSKFPEGYVAPTNRNILVETFRSSTVDSQGISEGSDSEPLVIKVSDVRSLQEGWQQVTEGKYSLLGSIYLEDQVENDLELGHRSEGSSGCQEGSEEHQEDESLTAISALNLYSVKNVRDKNRISNLGKPRKSGTVGVAPMPESVFGVDNGGGNNERSNEAQIDSSVVTPRKRGRPRKRQRSEEPLIESPVKPRKRGRPNKIGPSKCDYCGIELQNDADFISHNLTHNDTKPFKCATCAEGFCTRALLTNHQLTHMGRLEKFICTICEKPFVTKSYLQHHMGLHTGNERTQPNLRHVRAKASVLGFVAVPDSVVGVNNDIAGPRKRGTPRKKATLRFVAVPAGAKVNRSVVMPGCGKHGTPQKNEYAHPVNGPRKRGRPRKNPLGRAGARIPGKLRKNASLGSVPMPVSFVGVENWAAAEVDEKLKVVPVEEGGAPGNNEQSSGAQANQSVMPKKRGRPRKCPRTEELSITKSQTGAAEGSPNMKFRIDRAAGFMIGARICEHCGIKSESDAAFIAHNLIHNDTRPFKCASCGRGFPTNYLRTKHKVTHIGKRKKFKCKICGKGFKKKSNLYLHVANHTGNLHR